MNPLNEWEMFLITPLMLHNPEKLPIQ